MGGNWALTGFPLSYETDYPRIMLHRNKESGKI
jgi:hypothetical protein